MKYTFEKRVWVVLRLAMGWTFLWPFFDKLLGLGFATESANAWIRGGSPTTGFLSFASAGPFQSFFNALAGQVWVDWLFMLGLLFLGVALLLGVGVRIAAYSGSVLLFLMWLAVLPPQHNPFLDDHIIYIFVLLGLAAVNAGHWFGLGKTWAKTKFVKRFPMFA